MYEELIDSALSARENAYAPYSNFKVGSAVQMESGEIFSGCNIENASYGATNCAERTAIFSAVAMGNRKITALAVVGDLTGFTYPCGICRQVMAEFARDKDIPIIIVKSREEYIVKTMEEILPGAFTILDLKNEKGDKNV